MQRAATGDTSASALLFDRYRQRLRKMVAEGIDPRLAARLDPSDVVQEALMEAHRLFPAYLKSRSVAFYPWLKQITANRLIDLHRRHVLAKNRTVRQEAKLSQTTDTSSSSLVDQLLLDDSVAARLIREELHERVERAVAKLPDDVRQILILRFVEQKSAAEVASMMKVAEATIRSRQFRALIQLRKLLEDSPKP